MKKLKALLSVLICVATCLGLVACGQNNAQNTAASPDDFRVTAYLVCNADTDITTFDASHVSQVTDLIIFGCATFDEGGNVSVGDHADKWINMLKAHCGDSTNIHLNLHGPSSQSSSSDWAEQMSDQAQRHTNAFKSGVLENNIKATLQKYQLDGVFFDYEFTIEKKHWRAYNSFIVSLDEILGDDYKIGMALATWDMGQNAKAKNATDIVALMSYDLWDENSNHATTQIALDDIKKACKEGYDLSKVDLGIPFYARPTTREGYWYAYKDYYTRVDSNGLFTDKDENSNGTGLVFSFNTPQVVKEKTDLAIKQGLGGVMVWHYACDVPSDNDKSLFNAIGDAKQSAIDNQ